MKLFYWFLCLYLSFNLNVFSQSDFQNGYIITNNNDTIHGKIAYSGNTNSSSKVTFLKDNESEKKIYTPNEIKGYRFDDGKFYVVKNVNIEGHNEPLFVEYLINGKVDIYCYRLGFENHYLIDKGDGKLIALRNDERDTIINNTNYRTGGKRYVGVLKYVFYDSPSTYKSAENTYLTHKSLIGIAKKYHYDVCKDEECIVYEKKVPTVKVHFGLSLGVSYNSFKFSGNAFSDDYFSSSLALSDHPIDPYLGLFLKFSIPSINERLFLQYELGFDKNTFITHSSQDEPVYGFLYKNEVKINFSTLRNGVILNYEFPSGKLKPVILAGATFNFLLQADYERILSAYYSFGSPYFTANFSDESFEKFYSGWCAGIGGLYSVSKTKDIRLELRYQRNFGIFTKFKTGSLMFKVDYPLF